jgi:thiol-disulfide isomerase/thioredoxin
MKLYKTKQYSWNLLNGKLYAIVFSCLVMLFGASASANDETVENFSFKDIEGKTHQFSEYRGKWVIVNYWGTYCPPCLDEIPDLISISDKYKDKVVVLGMDAGGTPSNELKEFAEENFMNYPIAPVQESTLTAFGIIMAIPTSYIITPDGKLAETIIGPIDRQSVEQHFDGARQTTTASSGSSILDI